MNSIRRLAGACIAFLAAAVGTAHPSAPAQEVGSEVFIGEEGAIAHEAPPLYAYDEASWCPLWTIQAGAVLLHRSDPEGPFVDSIEPILGEDAEFGWAAGPDIAIHRRLASGNSVEFRYFGGLEWDMGGTVVQLPVAVSAGYLSRLHSTELNWRRPSSDWLTWLVGFRWVELHEEIALDIATPFGSFSQELNTDNHLYGGQLGADVALWPQGGPLTISGLVKAGIYGNFADAEAEFVLNGNPTANFRESGSDVAFVGEIGLVGAYQLTDHWSLRGGYQLLWIDAVALASEQFLDPPDTTGNVFYHGALMGVELAW